MADQLQIALIAACSLPYDKRRLEIRPSRTCAPYRRAVDAPEDRFGLCNG
jgi:hypothetical protein